MRSSVEEAIFFLKNPFDERSLKGNRPKGSFRDASDVSGGFSRGQVVAHRGFEDFADLAVLPNRLQPGTAVKRFVKERAHLLSHQDLGSCLDGSQKS
jgi:hypothetical protein